jgi:hypothetical protein
MTRASVGEIQITKRTVRIGYQVYPLANIARVQTRKITSRRRAPAVQLAVTAVLMFLLVGLWWLTKFSMVFLVVPGLLGLRILYLVVTLLRLGKPQYVLVIETGGTEYTALSGADPHEIDRIREEIANAMETPPNEERLLLVGGDIVVGDKIGGDKIGGDMHMQSGHHNTFTVTASAGPSPAELDAAVAELRAFIAQLVRDGAVAPDGSVTNPGAVVAAVEARPAKLAALGKAITDGAKDTVLAAVRGGVAALVVALVGRV